MFLRRSTVHMLIRRAVVDHDQWWKQYSRTCTRLFSLGNSRIWHPMSKMFSSSTKSQCTFLSKKKVMSGDLLRYSVYHVRRGGGAHHLPLVKKKGACSISFWSSDTVFLEHANDFFYRKQSYIGTRITWHTVDMTDDVPRQISAVSFYRLTAKITVAHVSKFIYRVRGALLGFFLFFGYLHFV